MSVIQQCEATFPEAYEVTRSNRFRAVTDISPTSFMYPSFAYLTGNAVMDYPNISLINVAKPYQASFKSFLGAMDNGSDDQLPLTLCINDGGGSAADGELGRRHRELHERRLRRNERSRAGLRRLRPVDQEPLQLKNTRSSPTGNYSGERWA